MLTVVDVPLRCSVRRTSTPNVLFLEFCYYLPFAIRRLLRADGCLREVNKPQDYAAPHTNQSAVFVSLIS